MLGSHSDKLERCELHMGENTAKSAVREILTDADWFSWANLNHVLPLLAEASPEEFLKAVGNSADRTRRPVRQAFFSGNHRRRKTKLHSGLAAGS